MQKWTVKSLVEEYGVPNIRVFMPMRPLEFAGFIPGIAFKSNNSPEHIVECMVVERQYKISENYKIELQATNPIFGYERFYISDFEQILRQENSGFKVYILNIDGYQQIPNADFRW